MKDENKENIASSLAQMLSLMLFHGLLEKENLCLEKDSDGADMKEDAVTLSPIAGSSYAPFVKGEGAE